MSWPAQHRPRVAGMMDSKPGRWWYRDGGRVVCDLCPRECSLSDGGFGFLRQNLERISGQGHRVKGHHARNHSEL